MYMDCFETAVLCLLIHGWYFVSFAFSERNGTERNYPFLGSWIGSHPHRFVRCVVDRDAVERGDLFPGVISRRYNSRVPTVDF